jgi:cell division septum initiation protein DivIVA
VIDESLMDQGPGPRAHEVLAHSAPLTTIITQGENKMAEVDTAMLSQEHGAIRHDIAVESARLGAHMGAEFCGVRAGQGDIRREVAVGFGDTRYNIAAEHCKTNDIVRAEGQENVMATKDARHDVISATEAQADRISLQNGAEADRIVDRVVESRDVMNDRFFHVGRETADLKAQIIAQQQQLVSGFLGTSKDIELNALKTQLDAAKNTTYLSDKITAENEKTRDLLNDLKYHDLNRSLVERNAELVCCESEKRHWRHFADQAQFQGQWAQLQSQIQAFQSQLQETRQGMVNFGTMSGQSGQQTSTSNNVR